MDTSSSEKPAGPNGLPAEVLKNDVCIHILVVISAGSISHALTPAVVMIAHDFLILTHTQCLKTIAPDKLVLGSITHIPLLLTIL